MDFLLTLYNANVLLLIIRLSNVQDKKGIEPLLGPDFYANRFLKGYCRPPFEANFYSFIYGCFARIENYPFDSSLLVQSTGERIRLLPTPSPRFVSTCPWELLFIWTGTAHHLSSSKVCHSEMLNSLI